MYMLLSNCLVMSFCRNNRFNSRLSLLTLIANCVFMVSYQGAVNTRLYFAMHLCYNHFLRICFSFLVRLGDRLIAQLPIVSLNNYMTCIYLLLYIQLRCSRLITSRDKWFYCGPLTTYK